jgi:hypothetical protein
MKGMPFFSPLSSWNCETEIHLTGTNYEPAFLCQLFEDAQKEWPEKYSRGLLLCHDSAPAPSSVHACLLFWTLHTPHISQFSFFS